MHEAGAPRPDPAVAAGSHASYGSLSTGVGRHVLPGPNFHVPDDSGGAGHSHRIDLPEPDAAGGPAGPGIRQRHEVLAAVACMFTCFGIPCIVGAGLIVAGHLRNDFDMQLRGVLTTSITGGTGLLAGGICCLRLFQSAVDEQRRRDWVMWQRARGLGPWRP